MTFTFTDDNAGPNLVAENAASGVTVGVTAAAVNDVFEPFEAVTADSISYSTTSTLFDVNSATGVITLAGSLDYETDQSHDVIVTATSLDGTSDAATFTIAVNDVDEFDVSAISDTNTGANTLAENASSGDAVLLRPRLQTLTARPIQSPTACPPILVICLRLEAPAAL